MFSNKLFTKYKFIIMGAILVVLVACLIFVVIHFYGNDNSEHTAENSKELLSISLNDDDSALSGDSCFLVVCNDDNQKIMFMFLADFRIYSSSIVLTPLSADTVTSSGKTYSDIYSYGGINMLKESVESVRSLDIDRYAFIDRKGMSKLTDLMGDVLLNVDEEFTYQSSDKSYQVKTGENKMGADMLYTYLQLYSIRNNEVETVSVLSDIANMYLENVQSSDIEDLFSSLTNCFSTDLSISDYYSAKSDIEYLINHNVKCTIANDVGNQ